MQVTVVEATAAEYQSRGEAGVNMGMGWVFERF